MRRPIRSTGLSFLVTFALSTTGYAQSSTA